MQGLQVMAQKDIIRGFLPVSERTDISRPSAVSTLTSGSDWAESVHTAIMANIELNSFFIDTMIL